MRFQYSRSLRRPLRLEQADGGQRFGKHALQMRQLDHAAGVVAHRGQVAYFGDGEQALVFGIVVGDGVQQIDVFHRRQPLDRKFFNRHRCSRWPIMG